MRIGDLELDVVSAVRAESAGDLIVLRLNTVDLRDLVREIRTLPR